MLTVANMRAIVGQISYKPGWVLTVHDHPEEWPYDPHMLRIVAEVPNAYRPGETVILSIWSPLPPMRTREEFLRFVLWRIARIEVHEAREFFRVDGSPWSDPHKDGLAADDRLDTTS